MDARADPRYLRLYREYSKAIQAFENAIKDRRRVRNHLAVRRSPVLQALRQWDRRPVGSPPGTRIPKGPATPAPAPAARARRIYLGPILGWAKIVPTSAPTPGPDPSAAADVDKLYDRISLGLYWNAKAHYEKCKREFFNYVRRQRMDMHMERAQDEVRHAANQQLLGVDDESIALLEEAQREVAAACRNAWAIYRTSGAKKSTEMKMLLLGSIADSQFVNLEDETTRAMTKEMQRLENKGELRR